jgi:hypothetical protein
MAAEVSAQGRCGVAVERIRTGVPAMMDAAFQRSIEAASLALAGGSSIRMPSGAGHREIGRLVDLVRSSRAARGRQHFVAGSIRPNKELK